MNPTMDTNDQRDVLTDRLDIRISVEDFGPIGTGKIELRPLTIFVGPSNAGKTYLAVLVYAIHKAIGGLSKYAILNNKHLTLNNNLLRHFLKKQEGRSRKTTEALRSEIEDIAAKLDDLRRPFTFLDLPASVRKKALSLLTNPDLLSDDLSQEMERCFDVQSLSEMVRSGSQNERMKISIGAKQGDVILWKFDFQYSDLNTSSKGSIGNIALDESSKREPEFGMRVRELKHQLDEPSMLRMYRLFSDLAKTAGEEAYYLPAARSGIMQSHRVIASSIMGRATRAGLVRLPELPTFSGVLVDFMQRLILYGEPGNSWRMRHRQKSLKEVLSLTKQVEKQTLGGRISLDRTSPGGYPEFVYVPMNSKQRIGLSRASSMVTELAPIVLSLKDGICEDDTLIIEEPEAHLHPAAQTQMAKLLVQLIKVGVRVIVTTHSDWLLKAIGNLMREGALIESADNANMVDGEEYPETAIRPEDVGIWLFCSPDGKNGTEVEEIPFDSVGGIEPRDFDLVDEELYNRSAELQNRMAERDLITGMK